MLNIIRLYLKGYRPRWVVSDTLTGIRYIRCIGTGEATEIIAIYKPV